jgi:diamine N-acetyltransferase
LICDYAVSELKLHQLYANIVEDNNESIALFEKMGFEQVAIKRDWHYSKGNFKNELLYQRIF